MIDVEKDRARRLRWAGHAGAAPLAVLLFACAHQPSGTAAAGAGGRAGPSVASASAAGSTTDPRLGAGPRGGAGLIEGPDARFWKGRTDLIRPPAPPPALQLGLPPVDRWTLKNGLQVVAVPRRGLPIVSFTVAVKAGGYDEQKGRTQGVADFVAAMLRKGTRTRDAEKIADAIDGVGGSLDAGAGMESTSVTCSVLVKDAALCLDLLSDILLRPTFPAAEMAEIRDQMLAALAGRTDDPHQLAAEHFDNLLFGEDHPDGWVLSEKHVLGITREHLLAFWKTFYRPNNAMLAVAGDFDVDAMKASLTRAFAAWPMAAVPPRPAFKLPEAKGTRILLVDKPDLSQATLMFGHRGISHRDPDWYAATLVNYVLGGSDFSSRLMTEVRSKRGLTYGIGSSFGASLYQGAFRISAATRNETAWEALAVTTSELRNMKADGPSAGELAKAKGYYAGSIPFELESAAGIARGIVAAELHGLGVAYVRDLPVRLAAVDVQAAKAAATSRLDPDDLAIVMVGRVSVLEAHLRQKGGPGSTAGATWERVDYRAPISAAERRAAAASSAPGAAPAVPPSP